MLQNIIHCGTEQQTEKVIYLELPHTTLNSINLVGLFDDKDLWIKNENFNCIWWWLLKNSLFHYRVCYETVFYSVWHLFWSTLTAPPSGQTYNHSITLNGVRKTCKPQVIWAPSLLVEGLLSTGPTTSSFYIHIPKVCLPIGFTSYR